jgi:hypothetical protein
VRKSKIAGMEVVEQMHIDLLRVAKVEVVGSGDSRHVVL